MTAPLRVALVDPYLGGSHRVWAEGYRSHSAHHVDVFGLSAAFWKWRMQGGHVPLAAAIGAAVDRAGPYDVLLATSTTNVAALLGQARHTLGRVPVVLYMHENQLTYPLSPLDREDLTYAMINWTSMTAADAVAFNSQFHHDAWFEALPGFLGRFPDERHTDLIPDVAARASVLPVGVDLRTLDAIPIERRERPLILWNQRWEHDKGPDVFAAAIVELVDAGSDFDVALAGERYGDEPPAFAAMRAALGDRLVHDAHADPGAYRRLLRRADLVVSAARQEFFGIAVTEAIYAGAFPVLPNRLVYPERIPPEYRARCLYRDGDDLVAKIGWAITNRAEAAETAAEMKPTMTQFDWSRLATTYDALLAAV